MMMGLILRATGLLVTSSRNGNGNDTALIGNEFILVLCRCYDFVLAFFVIMGWYGGIYHVVSCINGLYCVDCMQYLVLQRVKSLASFRAVILRLEERSQIENIRLVKFSKLSLYIPPSMY